jgi:hypothetical protein
VDVSLAPVLVSLHVVAAVGFIAGLIGRSIILARARRGTDRWTRSSPRRGRRADGGDRVIAVLMFGVLGMWARHVPFFGDGFGGCRSRCCCTSR